MWIRWSSVLKSPLPLYTGTFYLLAASPERVHTPDWPTVSVRRIVTAVDTSCDRLRIIRITIQFPETSSNTVRTRHCSAVDATVTGRRPRQADTVRTTGRTVRNTRPVAVRNRLVSVFSPVRGHSSASVCRRYLLPVGRLRPDPRSPVPPAVGRVRGPDSELRDDLEGPLNDNISLYHTNLCNERITRSVGTARTAVPVYRYSGVCD